MNSEDVISFLYASSCSRLVLLLLLLLLLRIFSTLILRLSLYHLTLNSGFQLTGLGSQCTLYLPAGHGVEDAPSPAPLPLYILLTQRLNSLNLPYLLRGWNAW